MEKRGRTGAVLGVLDVYGCGNFSFAFGVSFKIDGTLLITGAPVCNISFTTDKRRF